MFEGHSSAFARQVALREATVRRLPCEQAFAELSRVAERHAEERADQVAADLPFTLALVACDAPGPQKQKIGLPEQGSARGLGYCAS